MTNWSDTLAVFDLETTGIDVETSRIVSATVAVIDRAGEVLERVDWVGANVRSMRTLVAPLTDRVGERPVMVAGLAGMAATLLLLPLVLSPSSITFSS